MRRSNVALRLQTSLLEEAKRLAESEGVALNQLINVSGGKNIGSPHRELLSNTRRPGQPRRDEENPQACRTQQASRPRRRTLTRSPDPKQSSLGLI